jgi:hypothetical protein
LHAVEVRLVVEPVGRETNPFYLHGPVRAGTDGRFYHADGAPFFWFGDTWWMQMSDRVRWPDDFSRLVHDRASKGFNVAQIVLGFPCDLATDDPRAANEGGLPWDLDEGRINPAYFDACDQRIFTMLAAGLMPCILGAWGYHLLNIGEEAMASHWRYLVARYGALPVAWSLAGETAMGFYLSLTREEDTERQQEAWTRIAALVRSFDAYGRPLSVHPRRRSWEDLSDSSDLDYHMIQPGHMRNAIGNGVEFIEEARRLFPGKPVVNAEPPYEGHMGTNFPDVQRYAFWSSVLSGAAGFTYGAAGIFQANDRDRPTGNRPDGGAFDATTWDEALRFPGAVQLGKGKELLENLKCHEFEPRADWASVTLRWGSDAYDPPLRVYSAGVPGRRRLHYIPRRYWHWDGVTLHGLEKGVAYEAVYIDPERFTRYPLGKVTPDADGNWSVPGTPYLMDWLLLLQGPA